MRAAVASGYGPPEVIRVTEVETPVPGPGEVLVEVHATSVNRTDCGYRGAKPFIIRFASGLRAPRHPVWGTEFAGVVAEVGGDVSTFSPGDRVFGYNERTFGAHAEYMVTRADSMIATMPDAMTFEQGATATEGAHYALGCIRAARIGGGHNVMVYGATGGIGSAAVQLVKSLGATVTAVCGTAHVELVKGLGPDRVVDYQTSDFTKDSQTYDVVLDAVGKSSFGACKPLLRAHGIYMSSELGPKGQNPILALVTPLGRGKRVMFPIPRERQEMATHFKERFEAGEYAPLIDRPYRLDDIVEAYRYAESGQKVGNIVITVRAG